MSTTTIAIICALGAALALALGWKISRQDRPSDDDWEDWL